MIRHPLFALLAGSALCVCGCTAEQQYENAKDDAREEIREANDAQMDAAADGVITNDEASEVMDERGEAVEAVGELSEQAGELANERADE